MSVGFMKNGTFIECSTIEELHAEEEARIAADEDLQQQITECKETCASEMEQLQENLDAEIDARLSADKALQALIETEASQRQAADTALQSNIDAEAVTRASSDTSLQAAIDSLSLTVSGFTATISEIANSISSESDARKDADSSLQDNIEAAEESKDTAIAELQAQIDALKESISEVAEATTGGYIVGSVTTLAIPISGVTTESYTMSSPYAYHYMAVWSASYVQKYSSSVILVDYDTATYLEQLFTAGGYDVSLTAMFNKNAVFLGFKYNNSAALSTIKNFTSLPVTVIELVPVASTTSLSAGTASLSADADTLSEELEALKESLGIGE